jgi:DNA mismatch repair protein MutS
METPARRQYLELKRRFPDALLWFRMGDFYETFDADAEVMARDLRITLTSREFGRGNRVPMAGVPHHAATSYLRRLLAMGHRVAICEQLTEAGHGLVERDVVRVVTPGTVVEPNLLSPRENNYLAALLPGREGVGLAYVDVTTGEFAVCQFAPDQTAALAAELLRIDPAEVLVPEGKEEHVRDAARRTPHAALTPCPPRWFHEPGARERLQQHFAVASLEPFGCADLRLAVGAAGAALAYVEAADRDVARLLRMLRTDRPGTHMALDASTRRNLDLTRTARTGNRTGTLLHVLDQTRTPMGGRLLRRWLGAPLLDLVELHRRQDVVDSLFRDPARRERLQTLLDGAGDLERVAARARQASATARDLISLAAGLRAAAAIAAMAPTPRPPPPKRGEGEHSAARVERVPLPPALGEGPGVGAYDELLARLDPVPEVADLIERAIAREGDRRIKPGFSTELDAISTAVSDAQFTLLGLERRLRERTGIRSLKVGYNKVFGYYIEVTKSNLKAAPPDFIRRQTLANAERFVTDELRECEAAILRAEEQIAGLEDRVFAGVRDAAGAAVDRLLATASALAELDVLAGFAQVATERRYVRPVLDESGDLLIESGRHPVVEAAQEEGAFIANDCALRAAVGGRQSAVGGGRNPDCQLPTADCRVLLITGPNMAGKSTYLRQVALIVLMAQVGSFVPAASARIGLVDRIFTRVGAHDDLAAGASTFLVEMVETAAILRQATGRSLLVFDEIGRGTSTLDGLAIAQSVVEDVHDRIGARTLFATHFHELIGLAGRLPHLENANAAAVEEGGRVIFLHRIRPGGADRSYGIHVAEIAGLPAHVTDRARTLLNEMEATGNRRQATANSMLPETPVEYSAPTVAIAALLAELRGIDLARTTPLEALNLLAGLQERAAVAETPARPLRLVSEQRDGPPDSAFRIPHSAFPP